MTDRRNHFSSPHVKFALDTPGDAEEEARLLLADDDSPWMGERQTPGPGEWEERDASGGGSRSVAVEQGGWLHEIRPGDRGSEVGSNCRAGGLAQAIKLATNPASASEGGGQRGQRGTNRGVNQGAALIDPSHQHEMLNLPPLQSCDGDTSHVGAEGEWRFPKSAFCGGGGEVRGGAGGSLTSGDHVADRRLGPQVVHVECEASAGEEGEGWISGVCGARGAARLNVDADGWIRCGSG
jgi:hypothetical protein